MPRPGFTSSTQTATLTATKLNPTLNRSLLSAAVVATLARVGLVLVLLVASAYAQTYSAARGFSTTINTETSTWSYCDNTTGTRDGNYTLLLCVEPTNSQWYNWGEPITLSAWFPEPSNGACPCIYANKFDKPLIGNFGGGPIVGPRRSILEHPSTSSDVGDTVVSFLAPKAGTVTVTYDFTDIDPYGGDGVHWYVDLNSGLAGDLYSGTVDSTPGHVGTTGKKSFQVAVSQGDRLNFIIDSNGDYSFDTTALKIIVTY